MNKLLPVFAAALPLAATMTPANISPVAAEQPSWQVRGGGGNGNTTARESRENLLRSNGKASARTIEEMGPEISAARRAHVRSQGLAALNAQIDEFAASIGLAGQARLTDADVEVYFVPSPDGDTFLTVPRNVAVADDGTMAMTEEADAELSAAFSGPYSTMTDVFYSATTTVTDAASQFCGTPSGPTVTLNGHLQYALADQDASFKWYAVGNSGVTSTVTGTPSNGCRGFLNTFSIGIWSTRSSYAWVAQDPKIGASGTACTTYPQFSASYHGVGVTFSSPTVCERWTVSGANQQNVHYDLNYDHNGQCTTGARLLEQTAVMRVPTGGNSGLWYGYGITARRLDGSATCSGC